MPGLVAACGGFKIAVGWIRIYDIAYFIGMFLGSVVYLIICQFWPPEGLGIQEELDEGRVIEGVSGASRQSDVDIHSKNEIHNKGADVESG
jgi:NCS1 family nucleobase:cation symporter-1